MNRRAIGKRYEETAAKELIRRGWMILEKNYRCPLGEIDLIAKDGRTLVFVEVKYRKDLGKGWPQEAVTLQKQRKISRTAAWYLAERGILEEIPCRFDVAAIRGEQMTIFQNAFEYRE